MSCLNFSTALQQYNNLNYSPLNKQAHLQTAARTNQVEPMVPTRHLIHKPISPASLGRCQNRCISENPQILLSPARAICGSCHLHGTAGTRPTTWRLGVTVMEVGLLFRPCRRPVTSSKAKGRQVHRLSNSPSVRYQRTSSFRNGAK